MVLQNEAKAVPKAKVRVVLNTLRDAGLAVVSSRGTRLSAQARKSVVADEKLLRIATIFESKALADQAKLESMIVFAQSALRRWNTILKYFGKKPIEKGSQACDNWWAHVVSTQNEQLLRSQAH